MDNKKTGVFSNGNKNVKLRYTIKKSLWIFRVYLHIILYIYCRMILNLNMNSYYYFHVILNKEIINE